MFTPISAPQLTHLRAMEETRMDRRVNIVSRTRVSNNAGGSTTVISTQSNVRCWRQANLAGNVETSFGGQLESGLQWLFVFPYGTVIGNDDEIVDGSERFAVMGTLGPRSLELCRRIIATEK